MRCQHGKVESLAEEVEIEVEHLLVAFANAHPQEVAHPLVDVADEILVGEGLGDVTPQCALVGVLDEQHRIGPLAVTACPAGFLIIFLERIWDIDMHHKPHVGLVDAHAERIGCHHHAALVGSPFVLFVLLVLDIESRVVEVGTDAQSVEFVADLLGTLAGTHVDDGRSGHRAQDMCQFGGFFLGVANDIREVAARETHREHVRFPELQAALNVLNHNGGSRCRQCQHGNLREKFAHLGDAQK